MSSQETPAIEMGGGWGGWNHALTAWDWNAAQLKGYPGWETFPQPDGDHPAWVHFRCVVGRPPGSRAVAIAFDDLATAGFYYRDWTGDGIPFVREGEAYQSRFWFARASDADLLCALLDEKEVEYQRSPERAATSGD